jgi:hypothetical protein
MADQTEPFINHLLSLMSLDEKIGQLNQYFAWGELDPEVIKQGKIATFTPELAEPAASVAAKEAALR